MGLAAGTLLVMGGLGIFLIPIVRDTGGFAYIFSGIAWYYQLLLGATFGLITAKAGWGIVQMPYLAKVKAFFAGIFKQLKLNFKEILFISLCAGVGEELLFRGSVQPLLGIWSTAILFVLLHGYLNPFNAPMMLYGLYMTVVIAVMGYLTEYYGIITAMSAHFAIDAYLLYALSTADTNGPDSGDRGGADSSQQHTGSD